MTKETWSGNLSDKTTSSSKRDLGHDVFTLHERSFRHGIAGMHLLWGCNTCIKYERVGEANYVRSRYHVFLSSACVGSHSLVLIVVWTERVMPPYYIYF